MSSEGWSEQSPATHDDKGDSNADAMMNRSLLDPPRWGWSACGTVVDLLPPHERARRRSTRDAYLRRTKWNDAAKWKKGGKSIPLLSGPSNSNAQHPPQFPSSVRKSVLEATVGEPSIPDSVSDERRNSMQSQSTLQQSNDVQRISTEGLGQQNPQNERKDIEMPGTISSEGRVQPVNGIAIAATAGSCAETARLGDIASTKQTTTGADNSDAGVSSRSISPPSPCNKTIEVNGVNDAGVLDMFSYHRGREGLEPRDKETGELLCDVEPTDTNHGWGEPNLTTSIEISFPLSESTDGEGCAEDESAADSSNLHDIDSPGAGAQSTEISEDGSVFKGNNLSVPQFRETIEWDLSDPQTPTAMSFASGVAEEFGLGYGQTLDLATSIQRQIDDFVRSNATYNAPLSSKDPYCNDRGFTPLVPPAFAMPPQLYGNSVKEDGGGFNARHSAGRQRKVSSQRTGNIRRSSSERATSFGPGVVPNHLLPKHDGPLPVKAWSKPGATLSNGVKFSTEPEYRAEVLKRAKAASVAEIERISREERDDGLVGVVIHEHNYVCHICHARKPHTARFSCGLQSHAFCEVHCKTRLGFSIKDPNSVPVLLDHCPICCLQCVCPKCARRLDSVSQEMKRRSLRQGTKVEETDFPDVLGHCATNRTIQKKAIPRIGTARTSSRRRDSAGVSVPEDSDEDSSTKRGNRTSGKLEDRGRMEKENIVVPKVPAAEFPREVCGGRDVDPATPDDYRTMFSEKGNFIVRKEISDVQGTVSGSNPGEVQEDGNVDYCHVCKKAGNLLCCDRCPRAFHRECIDSSALPEDWECQTCIREKAGLDEDLVDGKTSINAICTAFVELEYKKGSVENLQILSMIHEMVTKLMKYEFGELFRAPVDCNAVLGYKEMIKRPMDLGTIGSKLINGEYSKRLGADSSLEDVVVSVLQDIELVWHNCFTFNFQGSSIYRMAEVQRRRSHMIRKRSFDHLLSESVKRRLNEYVAECERERGVLSPVDAMHGDSHLNRRPRGRNKITVRFSHGGTCRSVAVLDPSSGMIAKMYRSMSAACLAAKCLSDLGYKSEYATITDYVVKAVIKRSSKDSSELLFGYRWLFFDDLRSGKVRFSKEGVDTSQSSLQAKRVKGNSGKPKVDSSYVEMVDGDTKYVFISVEEAISHHSLPSDTPIDVLRRRLLSQPEGECFDFMGRSWRRIPKLAKDQESGSANALDGKASTEVKVDIALCPSSSDGLSTESSCFREDGLESTFPPDVTIVKEDLISRRKLLGFETVQSAYQDWLATRSITPSFPGTESTEITYFQKYYLDGDRNIDGVVWKSLQRQALNAQCGASDEVVHREMKSSEGDPEVAKSLESSALTGEPKSVAGSVNVSPSKDSVHEESREETLDGQCLEHSSIPGEGLVNGQNQKTQQSLMQLAIIAGKSASIRLQNFSHETKMREEELRTGRLSPRGISTTGVETRKGLNEKEKTRSFSTVENSKSDRLLQLVQPPFQKSTDAAPNGRDKQGSKRKRNSDGVGSNRVSKKVAITSA